jgi:hypothetical protein
MVLCYLTFIQPYCVLRYSVSHVSVIANVWVRGHNDMQAIDNGNGIVWYRIL